ncbi:MAG: hypothetical protein V7L29_15625 [Nostoc sp.]|uniref:hypothetical protein n=1 Tax=Nostoc sp. TaxID=1180 RepID=UPI002FFB15F6
MISTTWTYSKNTFDNRHSAPSTVTIGFSHFHSDLMLYLIQKSSNQDCDRLRRGVAHRASTKPQNLKIRNVTL